MSRGICEEIRKEFHYIYYIMQKGLFQPKYTESTERKNLHRDGAGHSLSKKVAISGLF